MGFNFLKATELLRGGTLHFITKLPSILSFPKKLLPTIFQFSRIDSKFWYRVEIRFSNNPRQKDTTDDIIWLRRKKCVIYRLDVIFSKTRNVVQLMVSKINLCCKREIRRYP